MTLSNNTIADIRALRTLRDTAKKANKDVESKTDFLVNDIIEDGIALYVADKKTFGSYNDFIKAYNTELLSEVEENEKSLINIISLVTFTLSKGLKNKATMKQIKSIYKYGAFVTFANLTDNKAINAEIVTARKAYEIALKSNNVALVTTLEKKSSLQLSVISEITSIMKRDAKKAEKKALKDATKKA